jgi:YfiH family protein
VLTYAPWGAAPGLRHGFLDRRACAGATRWEPVVAAAGAALPVATARQAHGTRVAVVSAADAPLGEADALVTRTAGLLVGVVTADCVPVLLLARGARAAAAVHAGWRGAAAGVLEAAVARLCAVAGTAPAALEAVLGPAIGPCCYEVGPEVRAAFRARTGDLTASAFGPAGPRERLDLRTACRQLLAAAGVPTVGVLGPCTRCDQRYCSYRRDGPGAGRQLSFIGWA